VKTGKIQSVCADALGISRKNIYYKRTLPEKDTALAEEIKKVHKIDSAYGHRRVA
jgi:hypothetical protein